MPAHRLKFDLVADGEWLRTRVVRCCDCGLVHRLRFRVRGGRVEFAATRDRRETMRQRRGRRFKKR